MKVTHFDSTSILLEPMAVVLWRRLQSSSVPIAVAYQWACQDL